MVGHWYFLYFRPCLKERERGVIRMVSCEKSSSSHQSHPSAEKYLEILSNFVQLWFCRFPHNRPYVSPLTVYNTNPHSSGITLGVFHLCFFSIMMMMILINELFVWFRITDPMFRLWLPLRVSCHQRITWAEIHGCFVFIDKVHVFPHYGPYVSPFVVYNKTISQIHFGCFVQETTLLGNFLRSFPFIESIHPSVISHTRRFIIHHQKEK